MKPKKFSKGKREWKTHKLRSDENMGGLIFCKDFTHIEKLIDPSTCAQFFSFDSMQAWHQFDFHCINVSLYKFVTELSAMAKSDIMMKNRYLLSENKLFSLHD